jgi:tRNA 2-thiocytidine biosynthesis protein TtcA
LLDQLAQENPKVPSNILHALSSIKPSQLMDKTFWDFKNLEQQQGSSSSAFPMDEMETAFG